MAAIARATSNALPRLVTSSPFPISQRVTGAMANGREPIEAAAVEQRERPSSDGRRIYLDAAHRLGEGVGAARILHQGNRGRLESANIADGRPIPEVYAVAVPTPEGRA